MLIAFGAAACIPRIALAQAGDAATAQALYDQAKALTAQAKYAEACPKFEESQRLDPGSGTLLNLGDCYEHQGRTASAWSTFLEAAAAARNSGNSEREQVARDRAAALTDKLSKMEVDVPEASRLPGLTITRDNVTVGSPLWGTAAPIDPGKHRISATAPGRQRWDSDFVVEPGGQAKTVQVPTLAAAPAGQTTETAPGAAATGAVPATEPTDNSEPEKRGGLGTGRTLALVAGGVGVVGLGIGTVFGLQSKSKHDEAANHCDGSACRDHQGVDLKNQAMSAGNIATVGFIVGAAGLVGGTVLWFTASPDSSSASTRVGIGPGSVMLRGAW